MKHPTDFWNKIVPRLFQSNDDRSSKDVICISYQNYDGEVLFLPADWCTWIVGPYSSHLKRNSAACCNPPLMTVRHQHIKRARSMASKFAQRD